VDVIAFFAWTQDDVIWSEHIKCEICSLSILIFQRALVAMTTAMRVMTRCIQGSTSFFFWLVVDIFCIVDFEFVVL
jgi:hypothetical protein